MLLMWRAQGGADDEGSTSSSAASAASARAPVSNWVSNWVHTDHTVPNVTGRSKRARARAKGKAKARRKNVSVTCAEIASSAEAAAHQAAHQSGPKTPKVPFLFVDDERLEEFLVEEREENTVSF